MPDKIALPFICGIHINILFVVCKLILIVILLFYAIDLLEQTCMYQSQTSYS